jgi:hypothetical protein
MGARRMRRSGLSRATCEATHSFGYFKSFCSGIRSFITGITKIRNYALFWAISVHFTSSQLIPLGYHSTLSSYLPLFTISYQPKCSIHGCILCRILCVSGISYSSAACSAHLCLFDLSFLMILGEEYGLRISFPFPSQFFFLGLKRKHYFLPSP